MSWYYGFRPYVTAKERKAKAAAQVKKLADNGVQANPIKIEGMKIAKTFWGKAWCEHLETFSNFDNRLPRGRTYVRNGSVVDLQIEPGKVSALVMGSELYRVRIDMHPLDAAIWKSVRAECAGQVGSLVELLQGKLSKSVMEVVTRKDHGLFPPANHMKMSCTCFDWADMCKHVAAVLYGIGARLDESPELLFKLRQVDHLELIAEAGDLSKLADAGARKTIAMSDLSSVFGIEMEEIPVVVATPPVEESTPVIEAQTPAIEVEQAAPEPPPVKRGRGRPRKITADVGSGPAEKISPTRKKQRVMRTRSGISPTADSSDAESDA